jgi:hypothetical protein
LRNDLSNLEVSCAHPRSNSDSQYVPACFIAWPPLDESRAFADGMSRVQGTVECCRSIRRRRHQRRIFLERSFHALQRCIHNGWIDFYDGQVVQAHRGAAGGQWSTSVVSDRAPDRVRSRSGPWWCRIRISLATISPEWKSRLLPPRRAQAWPRFIYQLPRRKRKDHRLR